MCACPCVQAIMCLSDPSQLAVFTQAHLLRQYARCLQHLRRMYDVRDCASEVVYVVLVCVCPYACVCECVGVCVVQMCSLCVCLYVHAWFTVVCVPMFVYVSMRVCM